MAATDLVIVAVSYSFQSTASGVLGCIYNFFPYTLVEIRNQFLISKCIHFSKIFGVIWNDSERDATEW